MYLKVHFRVDLTVIAVLKLYQSMTSESIVSFVYRLMNAFLYNKCHYNQFQQYNIAQDEAMPPKYNLLIY